MVDDDVVELARWRAARTVNDASRAVGGVSADEAPLRRLARGEEGAAEACVQAYGPLVQGLVRRLLPTGSDVDDVVQEVLVELWRTADRFDPAKASDRGYVAMLTRRRVIDRRRRARRRPELVSFDVEARERSGDEHQRTEGRLEAAPAVEALERLTEEKRSWILMAVVEGFTHSEIAAKTGSPLGTVKSGIRRGLKQMRRWLEQHDVREVGP
jgi:RNA polymerase sigma-70 factor (ECF subfamily)